MVNIHKRHSVPSHDEEFDTVPGKPDDTPNPDASNPPNFSYKGAAKDAQATRDAHYKEDGVKADLTGGKVEDSDDAES